MPSEVIEILCDVPKRCTLILLPFTRGIRFTNRFSPFIFVMLPTNAILRISFFLSAEIAEIQKSISLISYFMK